MKKYSEWTIKVSLALILFHFLLILIAVGLDRWIEIPSFVTTAFLTSAGISLGLFLVGSICLILVEE